MRPVPTISGDLAPPISPPASAFIAAAAHPPHSDAWHSPVPYLFGGLAAMLGLIAFALLVLACSYWKLSSYLQDAADDEEEGGHDKTGDGGGKRLPDIAEPQFVVIMAGDVKPTFLATPATGRVTSAVDFCGHGRSAAGGGRDVAHVGTAAEEGKEVGGVSSPGGDANASLHERNISDPNGNTNEGH